MNAPWWASGLFGILGTVVGALFTLLNSQINRRNERRRLSRETKESLYPEVHRAAEELAELAVWPQDSGDPAGLRAELERLAQRAAFFGPAQVSRTLPELLAAAEQHAATITRLRTDTRPGHGDSVDQREAGALRTSANRLRTAADEFTGAARRDLEIRTGYHPARSQEA